METLIRPRAPVQLPATKESTEERCSNYRETPSVMVEVGSVCALDASRIVRDFEEK